MSPSASIVSIGTELTTGRINDSHGKMLASLCDSVGVVVTRIMQLPDDPAIASELSRCAGEDDLLIVTGGLGPTSDDITRQLIAEVAGVRLEFRPELWERISARFTTHAPADSNRKQAEIPLGFAPIDNPNGTAPGFSGRIGDARVVVLPGPPRELGPMCDGFLRGFLASEFGAGGQSRSVITTFLIPESTLEEHLSAMRPSEVRFSTRAEADRIVVTLSGGDEEVRLRCVDSLEARIGSPCLVRGEVTAAERLIESLRQNRLRISVAESCTGGMIGASLTDIPGSSDVFWGGFTTYDNEAKREVLGVEGIERYGAVSREVAISMATGAKRVSGTEVSVAVTGIAGPGGGSVEKPVGTVFLACGLPDDTVRVFGLRFAGSRSRIRTRTTVAAATITYGLLEEHGATKGGKRNAKAVDSDPMWNYI